MWIWNATDNLPPAEYEAAYTPDTMPTLEGSSG